MRYIKPHYYDAFACIADRCPATCCAGWQIMIDDRSLEKYAAVPGAFGSRLYNSIDWEEGAFEQYERRCAFLDEHDLCDIYKQMGPEALCDTCRNYPRHTEEYEELRELSLSLSCPRAAEMILGCQESVSFIEYETEEEEDYEDFEEFDFLMFTKLEDAREVLFTILQNRSIDVDKRMAAILQISSDIQCCVDEGRLFDIDMLLTKEYLMSDAALPAEGESERLTAVFEESIYHRKKDELKLLDSLEHLDPAWEKLLGRVKTVLLGNDPEQYERKRAAFLQAEGTRIQTAMEQILVFFVYTYFCGSVYDDMVYAKTAMSVFCAEWIRELWMLRWLERGEILEEKDMTELAYRLAREIEHSDENLDALEDWLQLRWEETEA